MFHREDDDDYNKGCEILFANLRTELRKSSPFCILDPPK
ncbi:YALI0A05225p [Yarrowia lipolytica CLIB122]|uniref:YALI0A05225p n=1 Tax=Yarrowia lipolytica (strain CLIB 122 / E 150) TaxID=284591 RepID=Q6CHT3_YARLI|nr:YALI0A05225p [Yarrowia lipolytica CLIB122]CAG83703.2 YALI0A05225p [Yarrowia lipolytica CLIB122]|eukprot:XP_499778.2 YALI0A05225p [Yarrowia lipolytica CLIB122]